LDLPNNYGGYVAAVYYNMVDVVMPGLFQCCVRDCPLPTDVMGDTENEKKLFADSYTRVCYFALAR
jgi:hypothetical protein